MEIKICVDKRTELLGVLLLISDYGKLYPELVEVCHNIEYREKIIKHFNAFKNEKAVKLLNEICNKLSFNVDAPIALIWQLDENYRFDKLLPYPFEKRLNSSILVVEFLNQLPHFVEVSGFEEFYKSNQKYYNKIIKETEQFVHLDAIENFFNEFYKMDFPTKFIINLLPHSTHGNYGVKSKGTIVCNLCAKEVNGQLAFVYNDIGNLIVHEFSHPIVNPLVDKYAELPKNYFKNIYPQMIKAHYNTDDFNILHELVIRSIEYIWIKYCYKDIHKGRTPAEQADFVKGKHKEIGFIYLDILTKLMEEYYLNRDKYRNFEEFMPTLIKQFKKEKTLMDKTTNITR